jgi:hypothetical protein
MESSDLELQNLTAILGQLRAGCALHVDNRTMKQLFGNYGPDGQAAAREFAAQNKCYFRYEMSLLKGLFEPAVSEAAGGGR